MLAGTGVGNLANWERGWSGDGGGGGDGDGERDGVGDGGGEGDGDGVYLGEWIMCLTSSSSGSLIPGSLLETKY